MSVLHFHHDDRCAKNGRAFTLVEVLVVVAIVTVLAGILFPILLTAQAKARMTSCANNLRQLHAAFAMYASDNDGYLPFYHNRIDRLNFGPDQSKLLVAAITPYAPEKQIWFCPADPFARVDRAGAETGSINHHLTSYLYYGSAKSEILASGHHPQTIDLREFRVSPAEKALLTDNAWDCRNFPEWKDTSEFSHSGKRCNVIYFDGHIGSFTLTGNHCWDLRS